MAPLIHILHLEDDPADAELIQIKIEEAELACRITGVQTRDEFDEALNRGRYDIILADFRLPMYDGMSALRRTQEKCPDIPFIFVSGTMGEEAAIEGLTQGATDYVLKQNLSRLPSAIKRALNEAQNRRDRQQAERALAESEAKMRSILRNIGVGVALISPQMEILELNRRMHQWFPGIDLGQRPICFKAFNTPPRQEICSYCPTCKTLQDGLIHEATTETPQGGGIRNYRVVSTPLFNADGEVVAVIEMVDDITERKLADMRLNEQLHFLQQLLDSIPIPVYYKDPEGLYLGCNGAFEAFIGLAKKDIVGKTVQEVVPKERADKHHEADLALLCQPGVQTYEVSGRYKDGKHRDVIFYKATFVDASNCVAGTVGTLMDITERKQAERERLANLKFFESMDKVNRAIQGAHDLEKMMKDLLDVVLSIFDCDRAFLMYPCDPDSPTWTNPMERNKPGYSGVLDLQLEMPMDPQVAETLRILLAADGPVAFGPGTPHALPEDVSKQFGIKCFLSMAIYPKTGSPWQFGIHQCAYARIWTAEEMKVFEATGRRLADSLSSLLSYRDLRKNEEFLDNVVEHIPNMIFVKDAQTLRFVRFNKAGEQLVGYSREELLGKTDHDFFHKKEADFFRAKDREVLAARRLVDIAEETIQNKHKEKRILHTQKIPILDQTGTPQYLLGISEDITERKKAEASIRKLSQAIEQSPVSIVITDAAGNIEFVNSTFSQITGYSYAEAIGSNPRIMKSGETPAEEYRQLWETISKGGVWRGEFHNRKKNGELFREQATIAPVRNADDVITHYVAVKEDITERKKLEAQLRQAQKMEAIGTLAGGIAHDFNNILSAIIGFTELAMDTVENDSRAYSDLQQVLNAGRRAKELVFQILTFSRQREQKQKSPVNIKHLAKEVLKLIRASLPTNIEIRDNLQSSSPVNADPTQIHQVLMNLCTNAGHAMQEKGGMLTIVVADILLDSNFTDRYPELTPGPYLKLTVSDTGCGMPADVLERIFDPFFSTKADGEGTGLGLSMVHGIVKSHGGTITVYSEPGQGTTFNILLPAMKPGVASEKPWEENIPTGTERILFIDDETALVDLGARILQSLGYKVTTRTNGLEALDLFRAQPDRFDLVITDMTMPHITGDRIAEEMMRIRADMPIILCTGFSARINEKKAIAMGIRGFVLKPIIISDLARKIRLVLDQPEKER